MASNNDMKREVINITGRDEDEHLIVYPNGQLGFYLPRLCSGVIMALCRIHDGRRVRGKSFEVDKGQSKVRITFQFLLSFSETI